MPAFYSRIFIFYNLIYSTFLYILPKTLKHFLPKSKTHQEQIQNNVVDVNNNSNVSRPRQVDQPDQPCKNQEELEHIFQIFDKNGDGRITKHELHDSLTSMHIFMSEVELENMIEKIDVNGDGCVDVEEFGEMYRMIMDKQDEEDEVDMMDAFNVFDQNRDGYIAIEELKAVFESLGLKQGRKVEECRRMIMKVDVDGDGKVSFSEFKEMMRAGGFANLAQS